jgi:hypothetical protein
MHEIIERAQRLFDRRLRIRTMQLVEVDPIRLERFRLASTARMM